MQQHEGGECATTNNGAAAADTKADEQTFSKVFKSDFDAKYNIVDIPTPVNAFLSGQFKRSYAYHTIRNRLPVILTRVIDSLTRDKSELIAEFGEHAREELKIVIGLISRLKYELQTDKPFQEFTGDEPDHDLWNDFIAELPKEGRTFYQACWMYTECYTYRKLYSFVENSIFIKQFDCFGKIKEQALIGSQDAILSLAKYTRRTENCIEMFAELLKMNLWSNRNDLSDDGRLFNMEILHDVSAMDEYILINNVEDIWICLSEHNSINRQHVDIVLDNAGYELFNDFILAEYIIEKGLAEKVRFHVKAFPWYVSDTTKRDFNHTLEYLSKHSDYIISLIGNKFKQFFDDGKFELAPISYFWTAPHAFHNMRNLEPELYQSLQQSKLIIFKGDLNHRKLLSDVCWESTQDIKVCLGGFLPSNFCTVRTIKSEVISGLAQGVSEDLTRKDPNWMVTGNYGIIQFVDGSREFGY
ncbi:damage-control phosphatase ARMT1 [Drosophila grimshawi]|uniref:damage-control phosphatase ARMT1 n=1 Tax=Drosophila grimshawi TaxID=7222 RepID=UPI000C86E7AE|nr:damage-control phosphatase ARMT1 [Drosophila grimshawi]XP_032589997.1 damage-control phosphatase ARMT1 [Drosophila grimshawi]XP_032589998.1 damage-control phosphatase ARMT1 [Drosophila grimshawi]